VAYLFEKKVPAGWANRHKKVFNGIKLVVMVCDLGAMLASGITNGDAISQRPPTYVPPASWVSMVVDILGSIWTAALYFNPLPTVNIGRQATS
jgi:hypothetical protein